VKTAAELAQEPLVIRAIERLKLDATTATNLLHYASQLPIRHEMATRETRPEAAKRRTALANRMRELADAVDADPDARFFPRYGGAGGDEPRCGDSPLHEHELSLADWLRDCAEHQEATPRDPLQLDSRYGQANRRAFVLRGIAYLVRRCVPKGRTKNIEAALIASALLGEDVSANDVSAANRGARDEYLPRE
jgi:hypothetical protein